MHNIDSNPPNQAPAQHQWRPLKNNVILFSGLVLAKSFDAKFLLLAKKFAKL